MAPFRVIIVGGGITGLALANMLEKYEIDFAVLEKHEDLTPQLGAGYAMLPHGARILDQLGCFEKLESLSMPVNSLAGYDDTGRMCTYLPDLGSWLEERSVG
jgi:2-polyprenyl-6-methoxyphenol hydroxylase-like FAD-dependent oxidoreductase